MIVGWQQRSTLGDCWNGKTIRRLREHRSIQKSKVKEREKKRRIRKRNRRGEDKKRSRHQGMKTYGVYSSCVYVLCRSPDRTLDVNHWYSYTDYYYKMCTKAMITSPFQTAWPRLSKPPRNRLKRRRSRWDFGCKRNRFNPRWDRLWKHLRRWYSQGTLKVRNALAVYKELH